jgi:GxxExxY protein
MLEIIHKDLSYKLVGLAMEVHRELGYGFLEKVYENSLMVLLRENGIKAEQQVKIKISFHREIVGDYIADILVEDSIILEIKSQSMLTKVDIAQALNYLQATTLKLALLLNFGKASLERERVVL